MDYHPPLKLMEEVEAASKKKAGLDVGKMLVKGFLSGALLAYGTALAFKVSTGFTEGAAALVSGAVFPVGFAMIILLGMELATGNFAVLPVGVIRGKVASNKKFRNWGWGYLGDFFGCVVVGFLIAIALTEAFIEPHVALTGEIMRVARRTD